MTEDPNGYSANLVVPPAPTPAEPWVDNHHHDFIKLYCTHCGAFIDVPVYCGNRFCPVCGVSRKIRVRDRLKFLIDRAPCQKGWTIKFLTLTIQNSTDLPGMIKHLISSFRRFRSRKWFKDHVIGGAFVIEITGHPGNWHAHIHALLEARWMDWRMILKLWRKCSGGSHIYIKEIPKSAAIDYLSKYLSKPDVPDVVVKEIAASLRGVRLFAPIGSWFSVNKLYVKPVCCCRNCGAPGLKLWDVLNGRFPSPFDKEVRIPVPAPPEALLL